MEDDFDYGDEAFDPAQFDKHRLKHTSSMQRRSTVAVQNQPHDEEVELSEAESLEDPDEPPSTRGIPEPSAAAQLEASGDGDFSLGSCTPSPPQYHHQQQQGGGHAAAGAHDSSGGQQAQVADPPPLLPNLYNPRDFAHLDVPEDVQDLFKHISAYRPPPLAPLPGLRLRPFVPEFIPAVGGADEFIKVPRPDGRPDMLGIKVLDEPAAVQSDPSLLTLQLRQLSRDAPGGPRAPLAVGCVEHGARDGRARLGAWVASVTELHRAAPAVAAGGAAYSAPMPSVEALMQEWPPEFEAGLRAAKLPTAGLDLDLLQYAKLVCALLDVPVHGGGAGVLESLHLLFSLLLQFRQSPFFRHHHHQCGGSGGGGGGGALLQPAGGGGGGACC